MGRTPDRHPGSPDYESEVQFSDEGTGDPTVVGSARYTNGTFRYRDAVSVFDPRRPFLDAMDGPIPEVVGVSFYEVVTGTIPISRVDWFLDAAKTRRVLSTVYTYGGANALLPTKIVYSVFASDGVTVRRTVTDVPSYGPGSFENGRVRTLS